MAAELGGMAWRRVLVAVCVAAGLAGCTTLRADVVRVTTTAIETRATRVARAFAEPLARYPGASGIAILEDGPLAWLSRVSLADVAERTIDVQYYIYENDRSGLILLQRLAAAADRGVRVRLLIDDNNNIGRDLQLAEIDRHRNIEVRVFNPARYREAWTRPFQYLFDSARTNRRMHNKIYSIDGMVAIVGGRNIGDNYFNFDATQPNFRDLDLLVVGPAALEITRAFDLYWNSEWAYPAQALVAESPTPAEGRRAVDALAAYAAQQEAYQRAYPEAKRDYLQGLLRAHENLAWARVDVVVDAPAKIEARDAPTSRVAEAINAHWARAGREILVESAYFVPRRAAMARFAAARGRGVAISVLTNSLSSTDVVAVHAGYAKRREALLRMGVRLYEFRRDPQGTLPPRRGVRSRSPIFDGEASEASLHSKAIVFDREVAWVGSFNLDPRSRGLNTEIGLFVHSPALATRLAGLVSADFGPRRSWQVVLEPGRGGGLAWLGERDGAIVREHVEPDTTWPLRALADALALVPGIDSLL